MDTIFALASARGKAGVAVVRISGPQAFSAVELLTGSVPAPRHASLRRLVRNGDVLDEALVLTFDQGASFTGEQSAELQLHGSVAVVAAVERALSEIPGLRRAEPGEFTRRALMNERLDLAQVEGLGDLIEAETEMQRQQAARVFSGALGQKAEMWRRDLIRAAALLEVTIDFVDEDVPVDVSPEVFALIDATVESLETEVAGSRASERLRDGFEVAIVGLPNAGKSSLLNVLAKREVSIISSVAGTTRDVIEVRMDIDGLPVTVLDTAGVRETADEIESLGVERAIKRSAAADLRIFLSGDGVPLNEVPFVAGDIVVASKADLTGDKNAISAKTGYGIDALMRQVAAELSGRINPSVTATRARHRNAMERAIEALAHARIEVSRGSSRTELAAEEIRSAIRALDSLVGRVDVEHVLDEIFSSFCLGK